MAIDFTLEDHVATITINRPERMNAMDTEHYNALSAAWVRVRDDPAIRVAIVTGAGEKSFSAGADLKSFVGAQPPLSSSCSRRRIRSSTAASRCGSRSSRRSTAIVWAAA